MKKFSIVVVLSILANCLLFAIVPPAKGVKTPEGFEHYKQVISESYNKGYFAEKFTKQAFAKEGIKNVDAVDDTVFALTLLGYYSDATFKYTPSDFQQKIFDGPNPTGTVTDYYREISYNQMYFTGKVKGWFQVPATMSSYVGSNNGLGVTGGPKFVWDLLNAVDATVNFADFIQYYDQNNTPHIGFIAAVHSGADAASGANNIWSHRWNFRNYSGTVFTTNDIDPKSGKKVIIDGDYALEPEMKGSSNVNGALIDIGVFAHEFGHIFGLPDLYDTDNSSEGVGNWCLMAGGAYGGNGQNAQTPAHMSAWCKQRLGWITPAVIDSFHKDFTVRPAENNKDVFKIWKHGQNNSKEYFLIENRQQKGFDVYLAKEGILVYHVDENMSSNTNENHYLVDLLQADGKRDLNRKVNRGDAGDPFPGSANNRQLGIATNPSTVSYAGTPTYIFLRDITKSGENYFFDVDNGTEPNLQLNTISVKETNPGNNRVESGEIGSVYFVIQNIGSSASPTNSISITFSNPAIQVLKPVISFSMQANQLYQSNVDSVFRIPESFIPQPVKLYYTVTCGNNHFKDSMQIYIGIPENLLIDKSERTDLANYYRSALDSLGLRYEESSASSGEYFSKRKNIFIYSGKNKDTLFTAGEIDSLTKFVMSGGNLFLSGQNLAEFLNQSFPVFLHTVAGVHWVKNESVFTRTAYKVANDFLGEKLIKIKFQGADGASNETSVDVLYPYTTAFHPSLSYRTDTVSCAGGWIKHVNGGRVFVAGFGFESINNLESAVTRNQCMAHINDWFNGITSTEAQHLEPVSFALKQNYPNPFNPATRIRYSVAEKSTVVLSIYNTLGQLVAAENLGMKYPGNYEFEWTAGNLPTGVYIYQIQAGLSIASKKMMLLK